MYIGWGLEPLSLHSPTSIPGTSELIAFLGPLSLPHSRLNKTKMASDSTLRDSRPASPSPGFWADSLIYPDESVVGTPADFMSPLPSRIHSPVCFTPSPELSPRSPIFSPTSPRYSPTSPPHSYSPRSPVWSPHYQSTELLPPVQEPPQPLPILKGFSHDLFIPGCRADILICTSDDVDLYAHESVLKLVSPEIREKLQTTSYRPGAGERLCVAFARNGSAIRILLEYIYPHTAVQIKDFKALDEGLDVARTYEVGGLRKLLRGLMRMEGSSVHVSADPVRAYSIACTYGLGEEARMAARLAVGKVDFRKQRQPDVGDSDRMDTDEGSGGALQELQQRGVSTEHAFALMQKQFAWECVLTDVLLRTSHPYNTLFLNEQEEVSLVCIDCQGGFPGGLVEWQRIWAERVHSFLLCTPFEECTDLFRPRCVAEIWDRGCEKCMVRLMRNQELFDDWMSRVWRVLRRSWLSIF